MKYQFPYMRPAVAKSARPHDTIDRFHAGDVGYRAVEIPDSVFEVRTMVDDDILKVDMHRAKEYMAAVVRSHTTQHFDKAVAEKMAPELIKQDEKIDRLIEAVRQLTDVVKQIKEGR